MASPIGRLLTSLGETARRTGKAAVEDEESRLKREKLLLDLAKSRREQDLRIEGEEKYQDWRTQRDTDTATAGAMKTVSQIKFPSIFEEVAGQGAYRGVEPTGESSQLPDDFYDETNASLRRGKESNLESMKNAGLPFYAGSSPNVKSALAAEKTGKGGSGDGIFGSVYEKKLRDNTKRIKLLNPDWSEDEVFKEAVRYTNAPNFSTKTEPSGLEGARKLSEAQQLGANTPAVGAAKAGVAATVETGKTPALVKRAGETKEETLSAEEKTKQRILKGETSGKLFMDLEPVPGMRQNEKAQEKIRQAKPAMETLKKAMDDLVTKYKEVGWRPLGADAAELKQAVRLVQLFSKEKANEGGMFNLGVLNGKDLDILEEVINNPSSLRDGATLLRYGKDKYNRTFKNLQSFIDYKLNKFLETNGQRRPQFETPEEAEASDYPDGTLIFIGGRPARIIR